MKNISTILVSISFFILLSAITILNSSCNKQSCNSISCKNGGTCADGTCSCASGYYGELCENLESDKFVGLFVQDNGNYKDSLIISKGNGDFILSLSYVNSNTNPVLANWTSAGVTYSLQNIGGGGVSVRNGLLVLSNNDQTLTYTYESYFSGMGGGTWNAVTFIGERQ